MAIDKTKTYSEVEVDGVKLELAGAESSSDVYEPNADMLWARNEFKANSRRVSDSYYDNWGYIEVLQMIGDTETTTPIIIPSDGFIKTSDGLQWENGNGGNDSSDYITYEHTWDDTNARDSESYKGLFNKVRWVITTYRPDMAITDMFLKNAVYICFNNNINVALMKTVSSNRVSPCVEYIDFIDTLSTDGSDLGTISLNSALREVYTLKGIAPFHTSDVATVPSFYNNYNLARGPKIIIPNSATVTTPTTSMAQMYNGCTALLSAEVFDTSSIENMSRTFYGCYALRKLPLYNTSSVTNMSSMCERCYAIQEIPAYDTSSVTNMSAAFRQCVSIIKFPSLDFSSVTNMSSCFSGCVSLIAVPSVDFSSVTNMGSCFSSCIALTTVASLNTSSVTSFSSCFSGCTALTTVEGLNLDRADTVTTSPLSGMFTNCASLKNLTLKNIGTNLTIGSGTSYGHLLTMDSLLNTFKELIGFTSGSATLTIGSANLSKLENVYVKLIEITDEMREEDSRIRVKYPFEVCESTDEGAMHIINDYATGLKNWVVQ